MVKNSIWILPTYVAAVTVLVILNITVLRLGDPKFGANIEAALQVYAPLWVIFFAPPQIIGWLLISIGMPPNPRQRHALIMYLVILLALLELSFIMDAYWPIVVLEWVLLLSLAFVMRKYLTRPTKHAMV